MPENKEKTVLKSFRIPVGQLATIQALADAGLLGGDPSAVVRALLQRAIDDLVQTDYVQKHSAMFAALEKKNSKT